MTRRERNPTDKWYDSNKFWRDRSCNLWEMYCYLQNHPEGSTLGDLKLHLSGQIYRHIATLMKSCRAWSDENLAVRQGVPIRYYPDCFDVGDYPEAYRMLLDEPEKVVLYDTETTGLNKYRNDEVLQLSIINGKGEKLFHEYFRPSDRSMEVGWSGAERVHGISKDIVKDCRSIHDFTAEIEDVIDASGAIICYNYPFDTEILNDEGISIRPKIRADAMLDFALIYGEFDGYHENPRWQKLTVAAGYVGYQFKAHDSFNDCLATLEVAKFIAHKLEKEGRI